MDIGKADLHQEFSIVGFEYANVHMDEGSPFKYEQLNERDYLNTFFKELSQRMGKEFGSFQFYIFSAKGEHIPASRKLRVRNKVLIFISDEMETKPIDFSANYFAIFKAYLPDDKHCEANRIYPFPLGVVNGFTPEPIHLINDRPLSIYFAGNLNVNRIPLFYSLFRYPDWILRFFQNRLSVSGFKKLVLVLSRCGAIKRPFRSGKVKFTSGFMEGYNIKAYSDFLRASKIVLCPKGFHASETFRHYEAMSAGCVVISEKLPDTCLYRDSPIIQVVSWAEGARIAEGLLERPDEMEIRQRDSISWWHEKMSAEAASKYVQHKLLK